MRISSSSISFFSPFHYSITVVYYRYTTSIIVGRHIIIILHIYLQAVQFLPLAISYDVIAPSFNRGIVSPSVYYRSMIYHYCPSVGSVREAFVYLHIVVHNKYNNDIIYIGIRIPNTYAAENIAAEIDP